MTLEERVAKLETQNEYLISKIVHLAVHLGEQLDVINKKLGIEPPKRDGNMRYEQNSTFPDKDNK